MTKCKLCFTFCLVDSKKYRQIRAVVAAFVGIVVSVSAVKSSYLLALIGVVTGMLFLVFVRAKTKITVDEREKAIREKAANLTYAIFAPTIAIGSLILLIPSRGGISVFSKGEFIYLDSLGIILAYLALFMIALYSISYFFLNRRYGGEDK